MPPHVDLVIVFRSSNGPTYSKQQISDEARKAEHQYKNLLETLTKSGLWAVGRRGEKQGHLLVFISCPRSQLTRLVQRERHSDFLYGLPSSILPSVAADFDAEPVTPAERIRLVHGYITATVADGGLGVTPGSSEWDLIESVMALHDHEFNEKWIKSWTTHQIYSVNVDEIREQFGDAVALYFSFLSAYTHSLIIISALGLLSHFFLSAYSSLYSIALFLWSTVFVEWWRVRERILSMRWGTRGSFRVEKCRAQYKHDPAKTSWWTQDLRVTASIPVILGFAAVLAAILTALFVLEAFVTHLYTGPGSKFVAFTPTILFAVFVTPITGVYQHYARRFTVWENHAHQSTHDASLAHKIFTLSALVAYLGLALSAFVYVPFGSRAMQLLQAHLRVSNSTDEKESWWALDAAHGEQMLNAGRLHDQMFAYTVTNQVVNTFMEIGLPYILRFVDSVRNGKRRPGSVGKKKRVVFEESKAAVDGKEEREFLERVRNEVALPEYELFEDYSEMVTQFGYVVLWSSIWPLAPVMSLVNNFFEIRSDAFKIVVHQRRPLPVRTDTIGPWLDSLGFLSWLGALTTSALVYLFRPAARADTYGTVLHDSAGAAPGEMLAVAAGVALCASHGHGLLRAVVRHVVERLVWTGSREVAEAERGEREVKARYLQSIGADADSSADVAGEEEGNDSAFWGYDEGLEEIQRAVKDA